MITVWFHFNDSCIYLFNAAQQGTSAAIAQGLEHWSCKPGVVSLILSGGTSFYLNIKMNLSNIDDHGYINMHAWISMCMYENVTCVST